MNCCGETVSLGTRPNGVGTERSEREEDGRATGQPQGFGPETYLNGRPAPEDARKEAHIRGRSKQFMNYPG